MKDFVASVLIGQFTAALNTSATRHQSGSREQIGAGPVGHAVPIFGQITGSTNNIPTTMPLQAVLPKRLTLRAAIQRQLHLVALPGRYGLLRMGQPRRLPKLPERVRYLQNYSNSNFTSGKCSRVKSSTNCLRQGNAVYERQPDLDEALGGWEISSTFMAQRKPDGITQEITTLPATYPVGTRRKQFSPEL